MSKEALLFVASAAVLLTVAGNDLLIDINRTLESSGTSSSNQVILGENVINDRRELSLCLWLNPRRIFRSDEANRIVVSFRGRHRSSFFWTAKYNNESLQNFNAIFGEKCVYIDGQQLNRLCVKFGTNASIHFNHTANQMSSDTATHPTCLNREVNVLIGMTNIKSPSSEESHLQLYWKKLEAKEVSRFAQSESGRISCDVDKLDILADYRYQDEWKDSDVKNDENEPFPEQSNPFLIHFVPKLSCSEAFETCRRFGGRLLNLKDVNMVDYIVSYSTGANSSIDRFWIESSTDTCMNCIFISEQSLVRIYRDDKNTLTQPTLCLIQDQVYYLKIKNISLEILPVPNSHHSFRCKRGYCNLQWFEEERKLKLFSQKDHKTAEGEVSLSNGVASLIGGHMWFRPKTGVNESIIFTTCTPRQYTCTSGMCIAMEKICDFTPDCPDGVDEKACEIEIELPDMYQSIIPPISAKCENAVVYISLELSRVVEIKMEENSIILNLRLYITWKDPRVSFKRLLLNSSILTENLAKTIWRPRPNMMEAVDDDRAVFSFDISRGQLKAVRGERGFLEVFKNYEVPTYHGSTVNLTLELIETVKIKCKMELYMFPLDVQRCKFTISLDNDDGSDLKWADIQTLSDKSGINDLLTDYSFDRFVAENHTTCELVVNICFRRLYNTRLLNIVIPCVILDMAALLTFFLPKNYSYASARMGVLILCLIAAIAVFIQVRMPVPSSPGPTLLDKWMISHLCFLSTAFIINIIVIRIYNKYSKKMTTDGNTFPLSVWTVNSGKITPPVEFRNPEDTLKNDPIKENKWACWKRKRKTGSIQKANIIGFVVCVLFLVSIYLYFLFYVFLRLGII